MVFNVVEDVLLAIFAEVAGHELTQWPSATWDPALAQAPFHLSAVCQSWRTLSRNTPMLWSYFGFPSDPLQYPQHSTRVEVLLEASKSTPVDVIIALGRSNAHQCANIVKVVAAIASRWRNVRLRLTDELAAHLQQATQTDMQHLVSLTVAFDWYWNYLPLTAPNLARLYVECEPTENSELATRQYPSLSSLAIISDMELDFTFARCREHATSITDLCILDLMFSRPTTTLALPSLLSLTLEDCDLLPYIHAVNLNHLWLNVSNEIPVDLDARQFAAVSKLTLYGEIEAATANALQVFAGIKSLSFCLNEAVCFYHSRSPGYITITSDFFPSLQAQPGHWIWPALERIHFGRFSDDSIPGLNAEDLIQFVEARNAKSDEGSHAAARILEVQIDQYPVDCPPKAFRKLSQLVSLS